MRLGAPDGVDRRPEVQGLWRSLQERLPVLEELRDRVHSAHARGLVYRYLHHSFKIYWLQDYTTEIRDALDALAPNHQGHPDVRAILDRGTGREFDADADPDDWEEDTLPLLTAFWMLRDVLDAVIEGARHYDSPPRVFPPSWGLVLHYYGLR